MREDDRADLPKLMILVGVCVILITFALWVTQP